MKKIAFLFCLLFPALVMAQDDFAPVEPQFCVNARGEIRGTSVNIRSDASASSTIITQLNTGDRITILGYGKTEIIKNTLCPWFNIRFTDPKTNTEKEGWVFGAFVYYKRTIEATYKNCITGDFIHLQFEQADGTEREFISFQDSVSVLKWSDLTLIGDDYSTNPNPDYIDLPYRLTIEFLPSVRTSYDWDRAIDCKDEILTGVAPY